MTSKFGGDANPVCTCERDEKKQTATIDPACPVHGNGAEVDPPGSVESAVDGEVALQDDEESDVSAAYPSDGNYNSDPVD